MREMLKRGVGVHHGGLSITVYMSVLFLNSLFLTRSLTIDERDG